MNRYLILALYVFTFTLLFQYFFVEKKDQPSLANDIVLSIQDDTIVIPNTPKIEIVNNTTSGITMNTCTDIVISVDSRPLSEIEK